MKTKHIMIYTVLACVLAFWVLLLIVESEYKDYVANLTVVHSDNGVWDLSEYDFSNTVVMLDGNVEYIEDRVLTPQEFPQYEDEIEIGNPIDFNQARTVRLTIAVPKEDDYLIYTKGDYARTLFVNGEFCSSAGVVAETAEEFVPGHKHLYGQTSADDSMIEIIVQGGNFVHRQGSTYSYVYIGNPDLLNWYINFDNVIDIIAAGVLLALFIVFLMLAITTRNYAINLMFSLLCLIWAIRISVTGTKFINEIFYYFPWEWALKIEYISIATSIVLLTHIIALHFKEISKPMIIKILDIIFLSAAVIFIFIDTLTLSYTVPLLTTTYTVIIIYMCVTVWLHKMKHKTKTNPDFAQMIVTSGIFILFSSTIIDIFYYMGIHIVDIAVSESGIIIFAIFEAIAIFYINMKRMENMKKAEIESRNKSIELERFLQMKSHFLGVVAHEIKTPLSIIMGSASDTLDIMHNEDINNKDNLYDIKSNQLLIEDTVKKLNETVFDLLDTTALETGRLSLNVQKIMLSALIRSVSEQYYIQINKSANIFKLEIDDTCPEIMADEKRLRQVLLNLLSNACRHTKNSMIEISLKQDEYHQYITVLDEGEGISQNILGKIKSEYIDGGPHGFRGGIGLYVCNQIVDSHGGNLIIKSVEGVGTTVTIKLPKLHNNGRMD